MNTPQTASAVNTGSETAFSRALYSVETDRPVTVTLEDGSEVCGTFRGYSSIFAADQWVAIVKAGQKRATRLRFSQVARVDGERAASLAELVGRYIVQGDPQVGY